MNAPDGAVALMLDGLRLVDVVDILAVASFVYGALVWFRQARSRFVLLGVALLGGVYLAAQFLGLRLTLSMFKAGIAVAVFSLVIIFQEEIRRVFERIATAGLLRWHRERPSASAVIDPIVAALVQFAKKRVGALVVFKGREPLDRHLTGGHQLDGKVSIPLLDSIFDTSSAGHDGAVIIDGGTLASFGVHLPLSTNVADKTFGTRHTAALGLSERSDAMVLVVSEERGEISIAHDGTIEVVKEPGEIKSRLVAFFEALAPQTPVSLWRRLFVQNLGAKVLSLAIAVATWSTLFGNADEGNTSFRTFSVPVAVRNVPDGFILEEQAPLLANITLEGPEKQFQGFDASSLLLNVDVDGVGAGVQRIPFDPTSLARPPGLKVYHIEPNELTIKTHEAARVEAEVRPKTKGTLPRTLKLRALKAEPARIAVIVPKAREATAKQLATDPVDLGAITEAGSSTVTRRVLLPEGARLVDQERRTVTVTVEVEPAVAQTRFEAQPQ